MTKLNHRRNTESRRADELTGKVAVVTGAAQGIGAGCAKKLAARGCDILLADIKAGGLERQVAALGRAFPDRRIESYPLDVRQQRDCFDMAEHAQSKFGSIDIMVNSAGIISPRASMDVTQDDWENLLSINLNGVFYCCQAAARLMRATGGVIINLSSIASKAAWPGRVSYATAKAGITAITESLAVEWAPLGIRVNAVAPAWVNTEILRQAVEQGVVAVDNLNRAIPLGRVAEVDDVCDAIVFLVSDAARYITGQVIYVDGGYLAGAPHASIRASRSS
ncbi:MAG: SDR family NAD(P)-dependent oxidoreductase [Chloroflexi bacterium]|nr:SDR family NAD(P)-dependent oxidoreductase [Chloroflexota bacterium]